MRQKINNVDIIDIDSRDGLGLLAEINKLTEGGIMLYTDKYPNLAKLYKLLNGSFNCSIDKVHHITERD